MLAVVVSHADIASEHIGEHLLELESWVEHEDDVNPVARGGGTYYRTGGVELRTFDDLHLYLETAATAFDDPDLLVFASRHSGQTGPLLTAHATGNFGHAEYGGDDRSLALAAPNALRVVRNAVDEYAPREYDTGIECTHHGPSTVGCPSLFVEVGSDERQWRDPAGAEAAARAILDLRGVDPYPCNGRAIVGFGGGHYAPRFDRVLTETDWGVGHVASDWVLEDVGPPDCARSIVTEAFRTSETAFALVDGDHPDVESMIDDLGFRRISERWLRETTGIDLEFVDRLERDLSSIEAGLRFGRPAEGYDGEYQIVELPKELFDEASGVDRPAVFDAVTEWTLAYETVEGASRVAGRAALVDVENYRRVVEAAASILESKYDAVEVRDDEVVARREAFDPDLAREAGVEEGPAFGKLSRGESVDLDERTVTPADVRSARERHFSF